MPPAARVTDMHTCPMVTVLVPHVGGPILPPGAPTVLIDFLPAATVTSMATCVGPPDIIVKGSAGVFINFLPAARMGDSTAHGGVIILGSPTCIIGEVGSSSPGAGGLGGITAGLAAAGVSNPINPNASAYGTEGTATPPSGSAASSAGTSSSTGGSSTAPSQGDPLTPALTSSIDQSPALSTAVSDLKSAGWVVKCAAPGAGTCADPSSKTILLDPNMANDPAALLASLPQVIPPPSFPSI